VIGQDAIGTFGAMPEPRRPLGRADVERVTGIVREVAAAVVVPRFRALATGEHRLKAPGEPVTVADEEAEALLTVRLGEVLPGVPVVGEEACAADPAVLAALEGERAWLVDPLDGTANFITGEPDWAVMVALVEQGETVAAWMWCPLRDRLYVARRGAGATVNGRPLRVPRRLTGPAAQRLRGSIRRRFLDEATAARLAAHHDRFTDRPGVLCAPLDYAVLLDGDLDFILYGRTLPWDHAPPTLLSSEAGAVARRLDGRPYRPDQTGTGLLVATDEATWRDARRLLD
jgi:fructose-1,6-bisphosphatase/inositol monophosphatase family enzyme